MSTEGLETVGLNLDGNFATEAGRAAAKAEALTSTLKQLAAAEGNIQGFDANLERMLDAKGKAHKKLIEDATGVTAEKHAKAQAEAAKKQKEAAEEFEKADPFSKANVLHAAAGLLIAGGIAVTAAAEKLAVGAAQLVKAGYQLAVEETSKKEIQTAIFNAIGHGGGYEVAIDLAAKYNIPEDQAISQVKALLGAKFSEAEIPVIMKLAVGIGAVEGEGKAQAFLEQLQKVDLKGKFDEKSIKGFVAAGVDAQTIYENLAKKLGVSIDTAKAKVKAGQVSVREGIDAVEAAADKQFGGVAEKMANSVPALLAVLGNDAKHLFDSVDLGPIKDFLKTLDSVIKGPEGQEIKSAINELFAALNDAVLSNFKGEQGKQKLREFAHDVAKSIHEFAEGVKEAKPAITLIERLLLISAKGAPGTVKLFGDLSGLSELIDTLNAVEYLIEALDGLSLDDVTNSIEQFIDELLGFDLFGGGEDIGSQLVNGIVEGIEGGASAAIDAATQMATDALNAAKSALGIHSPSKEFAAVGAFSAEGFSQAMDSHPGPEAAGEGMAQRALDGAAGAASPGGAGAPGGGGAGSAGGMVVHFSPQIHLPPGSPAETQAAAKAGVAAALPEFEAMLRRAQRDELEAAA